MANKYLDKINKNTQKRLQYPDSRLGFAYNNFLPDYEPVSAIEGLPSPKFGDTKFDTKTLDPMKRLSEKELNKLKSKSTKLTNKGLEGDVSGLGLTTGDMVGMAGTIAGAISQISNSVSAAKATKKNVNRFKGFNEKALAVNKKLQNQIGMNKSVSERALERKMQLESNTIKGRNRGSATGISQLRALDLSTDIGVNESKIAGRNQLEETFGNQMINALAQEQGLLTQQDQMVMGANERVDEKDQQDLDNAYSNYAQNLAGITESVQKLGYDLNQSKQRKDFLDILPETNPWGYGFEYKSGINGSPTMSARSYDKTAGTTIRQKPVSPIGYNVPIVKFTGNEPSGYVPPQLGLEIPQFDFNNYKL